MKDIPRCGTAGNFLSIANSLRRHYLAKVFSVVHFVPPHEKARALSSGEPSKEVFQVVPRGRLRSLLVQHQ